VYTSLKAVDVDGQCAAGCLGGCRGFTVRNFSTLNGQDGKEYVETVQCLEGSLGHAAALTEMDVSKDYIFSSSSQSGLCLYPSYPGPVALEGGRM